MLLTGILIGLIAGLSIGIWLSEVKVLLKRDHRPSNEATGLIHTPIIPQVGRALNQAETEVIHMTDLREEILARETAENDAH
jgi:hypothetical protein